MNWELFFARVLVYAIQGITTPIFYLLNDLLRVDHRIGILDKNISKWPTRSLRIPTSSGRKVKIDIYEPRPSSTSANNKDEGLDAKDRKKKRLPVHVNFHGSGYILKVHGSDAEICAYLANTLNCIVIDADYAKAPQHTYPAAVDDALDVLAYVASQPEIFDLSKVTVGGFSAGANIALLAALRLGRGSRAIKGAVCWYSPMDLTKEGKLKEGKKETRAFGWLHRACRMTYLPPGIDRSSPKVSPLFADSELFPSTTLVVS